jgi:putative Mn2+ efflux pump MntP
MITIVLIALGLSLDAFAVSVSSGFSMKRIHIRHALRVAVMFGLFQAMMPVVGWFAGIKFRSFIQNVDHWVAFSLLLFIGAKMVYESFALREKDEKPDILKHKVLFLLSVATSIDALAVGLSFAIIGIDIVIPSLIIGSITFAICFLGIYLGNHTGHLYEGKLEIAGGIILIGIGIKILAEHLIKHI